MRLITEVLWGKRRGARAVVGPGEQLRIGSSERSQLVVAHDKKMAGVHLTLDWDGTRCQLQSQRGVLLAGEQHHTAEVGHGCWLRAGETDLLVSHEGTLAGACLAQAHESESEQETKPDAGLREAALAQLNSLLGELFAVVDTSRDNLLLSLLRESVDTRSCLYQGEQAAALHDVAPYLVKFQRGSHLLQSLVRLGWGKRWACFFRSTRPFKAMRVHLRRFLLVNEEASGQELYFRFYDPTVMRTFWALITPRQQALLSGKGTLSEILFEEPSTSLSSFAREPAGSLVRVSLSG